MAWLKRLSGIIICLCSVFLMSHNTFAEGPSILSSDDNGSLKMQYQECTRVLRNNRYIQNCSNSYSAEFTLYDTILNSETGEYTLLWRYPVLSDTIGADKYIKIQRLTYSPGISVASGNNIFYRIENTDASVFLGSAREFFPNDDFGNRYQYHIGGLNSYLWYSRWNEMLSCPDMDSNICQFNYTWNTITGLGSTFRLSNTFTLPQGWQRLAGIDILHNLYDNQQERFEWNPYYDNSVIYLLNTQDDVRYMNGDYYIVFETNYDIISEFYDMNAIQSGVDVNDVLEGMLDGAENISAQSPLDLNVGNSATATNLITYITSFISYIGNISPATDCNIVLDFPNYAGGSMTFNLCQFKDNFGSIISVFSSLVLIVFYIPLAYKMLSVIYSEIRSFTNG